LRLRIPELNEVRRKELAKMRINSRGGAGGGAAYCDATVSISSKMEKDGKVSQDDHERMTGEVQKATDQTIAEVDSALANKEKEIMTV